MYVCTYVYIDVHSRRAHFISIMVIYKTVRRVDRDRDRESTPIPRICRCWFRWGTSSTTRQLHSRYLYRGDRQGDLTPLMLDASTRCVCIYNLLLNDQREIAMGGRNTETPMFSGSDLAKSMAPVFYDAYSYTHALKRALVLLFLPSLPNGDCSSAREYPSRLSALGTTALTAVKDD